MARSLFLPGDKPLLHLALLVATLGSAFFVFFSSSGDAAGSAAYAAAVVGILGTHEMGHYLFARRHRVSTTLPYFIPLPIPYVGFGTLGAVIRIKSRIPTRNALVDIGAAGPLAGLIVAIPLLFWGMTLSQVGDAPPLEAGFPNPNSLYAIVRGLLTPGPSPGHAVDANEALRVFTIYGDSLLMRFIQWIQFGPLPPGKEVFVHPLVTAGWFGLLVTMLNLCPIGQLDGGHLAFAWLGKRAPLVGWVAAIGLAILTVFFSISWLLWLVVSSKVVGFGHPEVEQPEVELTPGRRLVCLIGFAALVLCVVPVPLQVVTT
jgi:membrane-associated protease RseP (regulator of RpoE activity)